MRKIEARALYLDFIFLKSKERILVEENDRLKLQLEAYEKQHHISTKHESVNDENSDCRYRRRRRRSKEEVERMYVCLAENCGKAYGWDNKVGKLVDTAY